MEGKFNASDKTITAEIDFEELIAAPVLQNIVVLEKGKHVEKLVPAGAPLGVYLWRYIKKEIEKKAPQIFKYVKPNRITMHFDAEKNMFVITAAEDGEGYIF